MGGKGKHEDKRNIETPRKPNEEPATEESEAEVFQVLANATLDPQVSPSGTKTQYYAHPY